MLSEFGFSAAPDPDEPGLRRLYGAWCTHVPFDNIRKLIHLRAGNPGPLPGDEPADFLSAWLRHRVGGTCWAGNGALHALLRSLGFDAHRGLATMLAAPNAPPNHGTVVVSFAARRFLVDASILHGVPLPLEAEAAGGVEHGAWGVRCDRRDRRWHIRWRPLHAPDGLDCRIERLRCSAQTFHRCHERSRPWSPFNYSLYVRANRGDRVLGIAFGSRIEIGADGAVQRDAVEPRARAGWLAEQLGMDPALLSLLPGDLPTPPPPGSAAAQRASGSR